MPPIIHTLLFLAITSHALAQVPYQPEPPPSAFDEHWRWTQLEFLNDYSVRGAITQSGNDLWFAVEGGLLRYDGYKPHFLEFSGTPLDNHTSLDLFTSSAGELYVLTNQGGAHWNNGEWTLLFKVNSQGYQRSRIAEAADGSIWFGTGSRLFRLHKGEVTAVETPLDGFSSLLIDTQNRLWIAGAYSNQVLRYQLDPSNGLPVSPPFSIKTGTSPRHSSIAIMQSSDGRILIATLEKQKAILACDGNTVETILESWSSIGLNGYRMISEGPNGLLWVASQRAIASFDGEHWTTRGIDQNGIPGTQSFLDFLPDQTMIIGGRMDRVYAIDFSTRNWETYPNLNYETQDPEGRYWFIAQDRKIVRESLDGAEWQAWSSKHGAIDSPNQLFCDSKGRIWAAGSHQNQAAVAWFEKGIWYRDIHPEFGAVISHLSAFEDKDGSLYFGAGGEITEFQNRTGGMVRYRFENGHPQFHYLKPPTIPQRVVSIVKSDTGEFWFGGMSLTRKSDGFNFEIDRSFAGNWIDQLACEQSGRVWLASWGAGVFRQENNQWRRYSSLDELVGRRFISILASRANDSVWAATSDSIARFDGSTWSTYGQIFDFQLQREGGQLKESKDGTLWINSAARSWNFNEPTNPSEASIPFESIRYTPDRTGPDTIMIQQDEKVQESANAFFKWSGSDAWSRTHPSLLQYSYRIDDGDWSPFQPGTETVITSNTPGIHTLEVRARDHDWNIDPTPAHAQFQVVPFLWNRPWFILSALSAVVVIITLITLLVRMRLRYILKLDEFKFKFFTNVSHELRTPLSVIIGPLESLRQQELGEQANGLISMTLRNAKKMQDLVNQLLDFRKVEMGNLKYQPIHSDLTLFLKDAVYSQLPLWEEKRQTVALHMDLAQNEACFDPIKLQRIIGNLLSNAIKYTPEEGRIDIEVTLSPNNESENKQDLRIVITDTGIGIPSEQIQSIFKPFHRLHSPQSIKAEGSGLGLAYTHEVVQLWGGNILCESPLRNENGVASGTRFSITLPLTDDPILETDSPRIDGSMGQKQDLELNDDGTLTPDSERKTILLVEDNADIRAFLKSELSKSYSILEASDGKEGLAIATEHMPDLIITDVMMPEMNGTEMSTALKSQEETSHIPVIMLTARVSDQAKLEGIESGADDYFPKPVNGALLIARVENLLHSRQRLREKFTKRIVVQPKEVTVTPVDEAFLNRAMKIVDESMQEEDFDVELFSKKMGMSRVTLYRKMKAVTGRPPFQFIREMRLKRAAQLLQTGEVTVSETIQQVGILDMSYFSKIFRKEYGKSPSEFRKS